MRRYEWNINSSPRYKHSRPQGRHKNVQAGRYIVRMYVCSSPSACSAIMNRKESTYVYVCSSSRAPATICFCTECGTSCPMLMRKCVKKKNKTTASHLLRNPSGGCIQDQPRKGRKKKEKRLVDAASPASQPHMHRWHVLNSCNGKKEIMCLAALRLFALSRSLARSSSILWLV